MKRAKLRSNLATFFERNEKENPVEAVAQLGVDTEARAREASRDPDRPRAARNILRIEREATAKLRQLESRYRVAKPRIGISRALQKEWRDYQEAFEDIRSNIRDIRDSIEECHYRRGDSCRSRRQCQSQSGIGAERSGPGGQESGQGGTQGAWRRRRTRSSLARGRRQGGASPMSRPQSARTLADFNRRDFTDLDDDSLAAERKTLEARIQEPLENALRTLDSLKSQLEAIDRTGDSSLVDQLAAVEQSNVTLREQTAADLQFAQLGMAIEIISHEFGAAIRTVRTGLRSLKAWADVNEELMSLYRNIRGSFDHLGRILDALHAPLQRRLYRKAVDIRGWEIHQFLTNLFGQRMSRHNVEMVRTDAFATAKVRGYPSSFYPVFANLVDNAIYWLSGQNERLSRSIELDANGEIFHVSDSGPGVSPRDRDDIFEVGFTRKPGGRGMGLAISRQTLREVGYDLTLEIRDTKGSTTFLIGPLAGEEKKPDAGR